MFGEDEEEPVLNLKTEKQELPGQTRNLKKIPKKGHRFWLNPKETELPNVRYWYFSGELLVRIEYLGDLSSLF